MNFRQVVAPAVVAIAVGSVVGCGGSPTLGTAANPNIRVVDAITNPTTIAASVNGQQLSASMSFTNATAYTVFTNGNRTVNISNASNGTLLVTGNPLFQLNTNSTVIAYQSANGYGLMVLSDNNNVSSGNAQIRFAKVAAGTNPSDDVYVTAPGASLTGLTPTFAAITLGAVNQPYAVMSSGTYEVRTCATGTQTPFIDQTLTLGGASATTVCDDGTTTYLSLQDQ